MTYDFWTALASWRDKYGLVAPNASLASTNGVCYTGEAVVLASLLGELGPYEKASWVMLMQSCELKPGLLKRTPDDLEEEAPDDYYGYLAGAKLCDRSRAKAFLWHGLTHLGFYNTDGKFAWSDCLWRQPQLITHALFAAGLPVGPFRAFFVLSLLFAVIQNAPRGNTDARRLGWLLIQTWDGKGWLSRWAVGVWKRWLFSKYPDGMIGVCRIYYGEAHPFTEFMVDFYAP